MTMIGAVAIGNISIIVNIVAFILENIAPMIHGQKKTLLARQLFLGCSGQRKFTTV